MQVVCLILLQMENIELFSIYEIRTGRHMETTTSVFTENPVK